MPVANVTTLFCDAFWNDYHLLRNLTFSIWIYIDPIYLIQTRLTYYMFAEIVVLIVQVTFDIFLENRSLSCRDLNGFRQICTWKLSVLTKDRFDVGVGVDLVE